MLSFFFIQLLTLSAYARYSIFDQVINDPVSFAQTFSQVNPVQVKQIIKIIEGLISDGQQKKTDIIKTHEDSVTVLDGADTDLADALWAFETARGERLEAQKELARLEGILSNKQTLESEAAEAKELAQDSLDAAQAWMNTEVSRVNEERAIFEQVIDILNNLPKSLIEGGNVELPPLTSHLAPIVPALIEAAKANPGAVAKVVQLVRDLIAAGENVRSTVTGARDAAQQVLDEKTALWKVAVQNTLNAKKAVEDCEAVVAQKLSVEKDLQAIWEKATAAQNAAAKDESDKRYIRETEVPILDSEDEALHKVLKLLQGLLN